MPTYQHLRFAREATLTERPRRVFLGSPKIEDMQTHAARLGQSLSNASRNAEIGSVGGFDDRLLIKVQIRSGQIPPLNAIPGIELVSQEDRTIVLAFADGPGLADFENRLSTLARGDQVTRADLFHALQGFDYWQPQDRTGPALRASGFPNVEYAVLDAELWPQERHDRRQAMLQSFRRWCEENSITILDDLMQPSLVMVRVRSTHQQMNNLLLRHRDVRTVDLPPRTGISVQMLQVDVNSVTTQAPPPNAPAIAVLDAGLTAGHPFLQLAVGDAQSYVESDRRADDISGHWHGTFVSGLALYGDLAHGLQRGSLLPELLIFSGKVFRDDGQDQAGFVEKSVEEAVRSLHKQYGCRVFNLSYGDFNKVYDGRHVRSLAYTLDRLTRDLGVLFVVPTGNLLKGDLPENVREAYPDYLFDDSCRLLDPAPALNVLTVGGLSLHTATRTALIRPEQITELPVAQENQPFPMTRCGPSVNGAIKPDLVAHAGNIAIGRAGRIDMRGLGVMSTIGDIAGGRLLGEDIGTSFAAPQVSHRAARLLSDLPQASVHMLRALLAVHARWPTPCQTLLNTKDHLLHLIGYGQVDDSALYRSLDDVVTLLAEDSIQNDRCHFYELPIPDSFWSRGRREREISVALAHSPEVRTTRIDYRMTKLSFRLVQAADLASVEHAFRRGRDPGEGIAEIDGSRRWLSSEDRDRSTLQVSRWTFKMPPRQLSKIFLVITRQDNSAWSTVIDQEEPYALAIVLSDRSQADISLYATVQARLAQRIQQRGRVRV